MAEISAAMVKELREKTGAGMMDCKSALTEANGSFEQAIEILRKKGLKDIGKRSGKTAGEGTLGVYVHPGSQIVAIVELNCETDFVGRGEIFREAAHDLAMHIAAMKPVYLSVEDIPQAVLDKEKEILLEQLAPAQREKADKILPGKMEKFYSDNVLLKQPFVKDDSGSKTVQDVINDLGIKVGEKVVLRRFYRFEVGEGIERVQKNLAEEVQGLLS